MGQGLFLRALATKREVDQVIRHTEDKIVILRFGKETDPVCMELDDLVQLFCPTLHPILSDCSHMFLYSFNGSSVEQNRKKCQSYGRHIWCRCRRGLGLCRLFWHYTYTRYCVFLQWTAYQVWLWVRLECSPQQHITWLILTPFTSVHRTILSGSAAFELNRTFLTWYVLCRTDVSDD